MGLKMIILWAQDMGGVYMLWGGFSCNYRGGHTELLCTNFFEIDYCSTRMNKLFTPLPSQVLKSKISDNFPQNCIGIFLPQEQDYDRFLRNMHRDTNFEKAKFCLILHKSSGNHSRHCKILAHY